MNKKEKIIGLHFLLYERISTVENIQKYTRENEKIQKKQQL